MNDVAFYRDRANGSHPINDREARRRTPDRIYGEVLSAEDWDILGVDPVFAVDPPAYDPATHDLAEGPIEQVDGRWCKSWIVSELPPPPPLTITADVLFFERMTDAEYTDLDDSVRAGESARVYRGWSAATSFTEGSAMWALLDKHLALVVSAERKAELLARPQEAGMAAPEEMAA